MSGWPDTTEGLTDMKDEEPKISWGTAIAKYKGVCEERDMLKMQLDAMNVLHCSIITEAKCPQCANEFTVKVPIPASTGRMATGQMAGYDSGAD